MIELLHRLVEVESPSITPSAHEPALRLLEDGFRTAGCTTRRIAGNAPGSHLFARPGVARARRAVPADSRSLRHRVAARDRWQPGRRASKTAVSTGRAHTTPRPGSFSYVFALRASAPTASPRP